MALFDAADLLARWRTYARRPSTDTTWLDAAVYGLLTEAQIHVVHLIAAHVPQAMYGAPELMTTADGGKTYTIPGVVSAGRPPLAVSVRASPSGRLLFSGAEWEAGADFCIDAEGTIRIPDGRTRSFSNGPYARYILEPGTLDGSNAPTVRPKSAGQLVVFNALYRWACIPGATEQDPGYFDQLFNKEAWGDPSTGETGILNGLKLQFNEAGERLPAGGVWYRSADLT